MVIAYDSETTVQHTGRSRLVFTQPLAKMLKQQKVGCIVGLQLGRVEVGLARELREQRLKVGLLREGFGHRPILPSAPQRPLPRQQ